MRRIKGFTLIELLIVIAIILILIAIALPNFLSAQTRAKVVRVKGELRSIDISMNEYLTDWNEFPYPNCAHPNVGTCDGVRGGYIWWAFELTTPVAYMSTINLIDPFNPNNHWPEVGGDSLPYLYANYSGAWGHLPGDKFQNMKQAEGKFCITSLGPDKDLSGVEWSVGSLEPGRFGSQGNRIGPFAHSQVFDYWTTIYAPTNGILSNGDIPRFGGISNAPPP